MTLASVSVERGCSSYSAVSLSKNGHLPPGRLQNFAAVGPNAAFASLESLNTRKPSVLESAAVPNRCVTLKRGAPGRPRRVLMTITPFAACEP